MACDIKDRELIFKSDFDVEMIQQMGDDDMLARAAWVSTGRDLSSPDGAPITREKVRGTLKFLIEKRHGCFDEQTDALTDSGWKRWSDVSAADSLLTISPSGAMEYQRPLRLVRKEYAGDMIRVSSQAVDLLVTPDHQMFGSLRARASWRPPSMVPAASLLERPLRFYSGLGWDDAGAVEPRAALLGFIVGDGCARGSSVEFRLHRERKVAWLTRRASESGFGLTQEGDRFRLLCDGEFRHLARQVYDEQSRKVIPRQALQMAAWRSGLMDGLMQSDGHVDGRGQQYYSTTSEPLSGQMQELCALLGGAATMGGITVPSQHGGYGNLPVIHLGIRSTRNLAPRVGLTLDERRHQVSVEQYHGMIYCATVPNGTVYVRRNGVPIWSGNSPFEHGAVTVRVDAPIKVWREWHRHRVGFSYNETSGRYRQLDPVFYIPPPDRPMIRPDHFKSSSPDFAVATPEQYDEICTALRAGYKEAYYLYETMLTLGADRGLARDVLGVGIYSACYVTCNPRSIMHFLELRTREDAAKRPSRPLWEIERCARKLEAIFATHWPMTHSLWVANGRAAP